MGNPRGCWLGVWASGSPERPRPASLALGAVPACWALSAQPLLLPQEQPGCPCRPKSSWAPLGPPWCPWWCSFLPLQWKKRRGGPCPPAQCSGSRPGVTVCHTLHPPKEIKNKNEVLPPSRILSLSLAGRCAKPRFSFRATGCWGAGSWKEPKWEGWMQPLPCF